MAATELEIAELRQRLTRLEGKVEFLYKHLGVTFVPQAAAGDDPRIIEELKKGNLIGAIKVHRELYNSGLAEAKQSVEELQGRLGL